MLTIPKIPADAAGIFWRVNQEFIDELSAKLRGKRVLEVFAGNGLMAALLHARGVDIVATSILSSMDAHERGLYHPIQEMDAVEAVLTLHQDCDVLLMCWPTVTQKAVRAAMHWSAIKDAPIVFIGEYTDYSKNHLGGCATDEFFEMFKIDQTFSSYRGNALERACIGVMELSAPLPDRQSRIGVRP